ncbi:hypothetical protein Pmani_022042 [Petrolisthes manimaculis]|uniref:Uncharacterized protein n=1 Tax=Petrolisthes manimaculis TaxID=1843537 RepID=A0AAE1PCV2_9EUCA|nr:hypothetical protein Pmani_022042 [Petrolisthes manimaculis]
MTHVSSSHFSAHTSSSLSSHLLISQLTPPHLSASKLLTSPLSSHFLISQLTPAHLSDYTSSPPTSSYLLTSQLTPPHITSQLTPASSNNNSSFILI